MSFGAARIKPYRIEPRPRPPGGGLTWHRTGRTALRSGWFGRAVILVEETRRRFEPIAAGHTPANWATETRWRRARHAEVSIDLSITQEGNGDG